MKATPLLRAALRAYPRAVRVAEGDVLLALALELIAGGASVWREAAGLAQDGLRARVDRTRLGGAPWHDALLRLGVPLAAGLLAVVLASIAEHVDGVEWIGWRACAAVAAAVAALIGLAAGRRAVAIAGALLFCAWCLKDVRNNATFIAAAFIRDGESWPLSIDFGLCPSLIPASGVLLACAVGAERRPGGVRRAAWGIAAGVALAVAVAALGRWQYWGPTTTIYVSGGALGLGLLLLLGAGATLRARGAVSRLAAALGLAALATPGILAVQSVLPWREQPALAVFYLLGPILVASAGLVALARSTVRTRL